MHLAFDIFQGIGVAAALGIRPFLPGLIVGLLALGGVEIDFSHTSYSFLQELPFLLAMFVGFALLIVIERSVMAERVRRGPLALVLMAIGIVVAAFVFAGSLARGHYTVWPGFVGGVLCAGVGIVASRPFLERLRARLDEATAAVGLPLIGEGAALLIALLSVLAPPLGPIALLLLLGLIVRNRRRGEQKYAGLRILR